MRGYLLRSLIGGSRLRHCDRAGLCSQPRSTHGTKAATQRARDRDDTALASTTPGPTTAPCLGEAQRIQATSAGPGKTSPTHQPLCGADVAVVVLSLDQPHPASSGGADRQIDIPVVSMEHVEGPGASSRLMPARIVDRPPLGHGGATRFAVTTSAYGVPAPVTRIRHTRQELQQAGAPFRRALRSLAGRSPSCSRAGPIRDDDKADTVFRKDHGIRQRHILEDVPVRL